MGMCGTKNTKTEGNAPLPFSCVLYASPILRRMTNDDDGYGMYGRKKTEIMLRRGFRTFYILPDGDEDVLKKKTETEGNAPLPFPYVLYTFRSTVIVPQIANDDYGNGNECVKTGGKMLR
nr:hypothetical protein Itr_chr13CG14410 [Ipomoea trifida]